MVEKILRLFGRRILPVVLLCMLLPGRAWARDFLTAS